MKILKRKTLAALLALSLLASLLPLGAQPAQADAPNGQVIYVGGVEVTSGGYWTTDSNGTVTAYTGEGTPTDNYIHYDAGNNTLTLHNATIKESVSTDTNSFIGGAAIGVHNQNGAAELTITLEGDNTIAEVGKGIYVLANSTGGATLTITGDGSLDASASQTGIWVQSNSGNASLSIKDADVEATGTGYGVNVQSCNSSTASLSVDGGSLTASGSPGILYDSISSGTVPKTTALTIRNSAIVDARGGGIGAGLLDDLKEVSPAYGSVGIVFGHDRSDSKAGTVYGDVELQEDLEIGEGERLTIPEGSSLTVPEDKTITVESGGNLEGTPTGNGTVKIAPTITTESLPDGEVGTAYNQTLTATGDDPITWSLASGSALPDGLTLNEGSGTISGIPATAKTYNFTVTATNDSGSDSKQLTLTVTQPVTGVMLDQSELALYTGGSATLSATVTPENATNTSLTWASDAENIATVDQSGNVKAVGAGTATITATAADGSGISATCTVTVTDKTYTISADPTALNFGSAYTGYTQPAAQTVTVENTGNQPVILTQPSSTDNFVVGNLTDTELAAGETATFTVQPKAGLSAGTYSDTITINGTGGAAVTTSASFTVKSRPSYNPPTVSEETTDAIQEAQPGETVTVDLSSGSTTLDKDVFETLAGRDVTLVIDLGDGVSWTVKGSDVPEDTDFTDLDLGVDLDTHGIPANVVNAITGEVGTVQITLAHDGEFGFTMTLSAPLGEENAGYWANLYHYDEEAEKLNFEAAAEIDEDGNVKIPFSHASQYAIVIDTHSHATVDVSDIFIDVAPNAWYKDAVQYAYDHGLMTGVSDTEFAPEATTTRAMIVSILARLEGVTTAEAAGFADVNDEWYATAVNWAASVGVVNGYEDNTFKPNTAITREQLAAILMNYASYKGEDVSNRADLTSYTDQPSTWAEEAMQWAVAEGLISGVTNDQLQPQSSATRAQVAAILQRFLEA